MDRPLLLRFLPIRLRPSVYYRFYRHRHEHWRELFRGAPLLCAPKVRMDLCCTDVSHGHIAFTGFYELDLTQAITRASREGGLLVDVGANYGYFSLLWAAGNPNNHVVAFEASPRNLPALKRNVEINGFDQQIEVRGVAVGRDAESLLFTPGPEDQTGWGGFAPDAGRDAVRVEVVRLDEDLSCDRPVEFLKIDVEGADTWVLYGAERLLDRKRVRRIHFEQNKARMRALGIAEEEAASFLHRLGYRVKPLGNPNSDVVDYYAWPTP